MDLKKISVRKFDENTYGYIDPKYEAVLIEIKAQVFIQLPNSFNKGVNWFRDELRLKSDEIIQTLNGIPNIIAFKNFHKVTNSGWLYQKPNETSDNWHFLLLDPSHFIETESNRDANSFAQFMENVVKQMRGY